MFFEISLKNIWKSFLEFAHFLHHSSRTGFFSSWNKFQCRVKGTQNSFLANNLGQKCWNISHMVHAVEANTVLSCFCRVLRLTSFSQVLDSNDVTRCKRFVVKYAESWSLQWLPFVFKDTISGQLYCVIDEVNLSGSGIVCVLQHFLQHFLIKWITSQNAFQSINQFLLLSKLYSN